MASMYYYINNLLVTVLPELPNTAEDYSNHYIVYNTYGDQGYRLYETTLPAYYSSAGEVTFPTGTKAYIWSTTTGDDEWRERTWSAVGDLIFSNDVNLIWTHYDIFHEDGITTYMKGSEPVPVTEPSPSVPEWAKMRGIIRGILAGLVSNGYLGKGTGEAPDEPVVVTYNWKDFSSPGNFGEYGMGELPLVFTRTYDGILDDPGIPDVTAESTYLRLTPPTWPQSGNVEFIMYFPKHTIDVPSNNIEHREYSLYLKGTDVGTGIGNFTATSADFRVDTGEVSIYTWPFAAAGVLVEDTMTAELIYSNGVPVGMRVCGTLERPLTEIQLRTYTPFINKVESYTLEWEFTTDNPFTMKIEGA